MNGVFGKRKLQYTFPRPKCSRSAVYTAQLQFSDSAGYTTSTLQLDGSIYAVYSYTAFAVHTNLRIPKSWQCTYRLPFTWQYKVYCMYVVYTAATLYCWQWTCSIYCTPLHLYCTSVWVGTVCTCNKVVNS